MSKKSIRSFMIFICCLFMFASCGEKTEEEKSEDGKVILEVMSIEDDKGNQDLMSIEELFRLTDANWNNTAEYQEAIRAYDQAIGLNTVDWIKENIHFGCGNARFMVGYVDEDDIPELFLCYETGHANGVHVFTYHPNTKEVIRVGEFSSFGALVYTHKENRILSQYGNHGYYVEYVSEIDEKGCPTLVDVAITDGGGIKHEGVVGFYGFSVPIGVDGSKEGFAKLGLSEHDVPEDYPSDDYLITDDEEGQIIFERMENSGQGKLCSVKYDSMYEVLMTNEGAIIK